MNAVIDCNIFVSAALGSKTCQEVIEEAFANHQVFYSEEILIEIQQTFKKPKLRKAKRKSQAILNALVSIGTFIDPKPCSVHLPDRDDEIYLATAISSNAKILVTGNKKHFPQDLCRGVEVISPRTFLDKFSRSQ